MSDDTEINVDETEQEEDFKYHSNPEIDRYYREQDERRQSGEKWGDFIVWWRGLVGAMNSGAKHEALKYR